MSATFLMVSPSAYAVLCNKHADDGSENQIFHCRSSKLLQNPEDIETTPTP